MTVAPEPHHDPDHSKMGRSLERPRVEILAAARPLPPYAETVIEDMTDEEEAAFFAAVGRR